MLLRSFQDLPFKKIASILEITENSAKVSYHKAIEKMKSLGAELETISACIGPCISQESYEVGRDFYERFLEQDQENAAFFIPSAQAEHYMFDLPAYVRKQLEAAGVKQIEHKDLDTYFNEEDFYSYRRTTHRKEPDYGRQISVIKINE